MNKAITFALSLVLLAAVPSLSGCAGGGTQVESTTTTTLGQELEDLDAAHEKGIITDRQYDDAKKKLIQKHTK